MANTNTSTNINGIWHSFATAEIDFGGKRYLGIQSLNWKEDLKMEVVKGSGILGIGWTLGDYEASADFEILYSEWIRLIKALGDGWSYKSINIGCQFRAPGLPLSSVEIKNCKINSHEISNSKGPAATTVKVSLLVYDPIVTDGTTKMGRTMLTSQRK